MKRLAIGVLTALLTLGLAGTANAHARCDGDFELVQGNWIATRHCQRQAAEHIANEYHSHITRHTEHPGDMTPDEFCRWHSAEIETYTYCSSYND